MNVVTVFFATAKAGVVINLIGVTGKKKPGSAGFKVGCDGRSRGKR